MRAVGGYGLLVSCVDVDALDAVQAGVGVAQAVADPVNGQGVGKGHVSCIQEHAPLGAVHVRPFDLGSVAVPVRPEDFSEIVK